MASVVALVPDLLFGSKVKALLEAGGHAVQLVGDEAAAATAQADVAVVDLAGGGVDGSAVAAAAMPALAIYSHVDAETKARADAAGFDLVVPRSRFVREGAVLVGRLAAPGGGEPPG